MIRYIYIILLIAISSGLYAQKGNTLPPGPDSKKQDTSKLATRNNALRARSSKQDTIKKASIIKEWTLSGDFSEEVDIPIDTVFSLSNRFKLADKYSPVNATLGNYGLPFYQLSFFDRIRDPDKYLYEYLAPLMHTPSNSVFMNTQKPYTELDWSFAGPTESSEQTFRLRHSQNINRYINFGLIYDIDFSLGKYNFQRSADKAFTIYSSYTGPKYKVYFSGNLNNMQTFENGGLTDITTIQTTVPSRYRTLVTRLGTDNKSNNLLKNRSLLLVQRYTIGGEGVAAKDTSKSRHLGFFGLSGTFSHILLLETNGSRYVDEAPGSGFYRNIYVTTLGTSDSVYANSIKNTLRFDFITNEARKFRLGGGVGIRNELSTYGYTIPFPLIFAEYNVILHRNSNILLGRLYNNIGENFRWTTSGELYLTGYKIGDFTLNGEIMKAFNLRKGRATWLIDGSVMNKQPSIWFEHWGGNNFFWDNNFKKEFRIDLGTSFKYPARKTEIKFNYAIIKNYADFGIDTLPSQYSGALSIAAITIKNELRAWKFHLASDVIIQQSSNSVILDLPLVTVRSAAYFEHLFRFKKTGGKLNTQLGADVTYNTTYHPYDYIPATGRFFRQTGMTAGNYPYVNLFINLKVKRTRIFVMLDHANAGLMGQSTRYNYFMIPNYPQTYRMFRYGISWTFYN
jgi:hypothetical protein